MQPKTGVTFRFRSWVLIPTADHWSGWTHCDRETMLKFIRTTQRIDEYSQARNSPDYPDKYRALSEVQVITWTGIIGEEWTWTPSKGWFRTPIDPAVADVPTGKGARPRRKSKAEREADRIAADNEIFGTVNQELNPDNQPLE